MKIKTQLTILVLCLICSNSVFADEQKSEGGVDFAPKSVSKEEADAIDNKPFRYAYDPSITEEIQESWYDRMVEGGLAEDLAVENMEIFTPENMQTFVDEVFKDTGFKANNVVDVETMYLLANMTIAKQITSPASGDVAIRNSLKVSVAKDGVYSDMSDREKQEKAENLMLQTFELISNYGNLNRDGQSTDPVVARAKATLRAMGINFSLMTIGEGGYVGEPWVNEWIADYVKEAGDDLDGEKMIKDLFAEVAKREE